MPATTTPQLKEGRYSIEQEFACGTDRSIFQAYDIKSEQPVAIVEVPVRLPKVATVTQREAVAAAFNEQAQALAAFKHKSAIAVRDFFVEVGQKYLVTDPMDGTDLASVLADQKHPFTVSQITSWSDTVLDVLNALHLHRPPFVYRHFRPEYVILRADGGVALALWGMVDLNTQIAGATDAAEGEGASIVYSPLEQIWAGLDAASQKVIVSKYDEASERTLKQSPDARSDIYSLGATLYHLVTGRIPVDALERSIEMIEGGPDPLKAPNKVDPSIPTEISDVIMKALDIRREYRFDSAAIMRQVMRTAVVRVQEREEEERREEEEALAELNSIRLGPAAGSRSVEAAPVEKSLQAASDRDLALGRQDDDSNTGGEKSRVPVTNSAGATLGPADSDDDLLGLLSPSTDTSIPPNAVESAPPVSRTADVQGPVAERSEVTKAEVAKEPTHIVRDERPTFGASSAQLETETASLIDEEDEPTDSTVSASSLLSEESVETRAPNVHEEQPVPKSLAALANASSFADEAPDLYPVEKSSSRGVMAAAAAVVVVCLAAAGGWFYFGSGQKASPSKVEPPPAVITQPQAEAPAQSDLQPSEPTTPESAPETEVAVEGEPTVDQQPQKLAASSSQKPKRTTPAASKSPAPKKSVTVDDLINDN